MVWENIVRACDVSKITILRRNFQHEAEMLIEINILFSKVTFKTNTFILTPKCCFADRNIKYLINYIRLLLFVCSSICHAFGSTPHLSAWKSKFSICHLEIKNHSNFFNIIVDNVYAIILTNYNFQIQNEPFDFQFRLIINHVKKCKELVLERSICVQFKLCTLVELPSIYRKKSNPGTIILHTKIILGQVK